MISWLLITVLQHWEMVFLNHWSVIRVIATPRNGFIWSADQLSRCRGTASFDQQAKSQVRFMYIVSTVYNLLIIFYIFVQHTSTQCVVKSSAIIPNRLYRCNWLQLDVLIIKISTFNIFQSFLCHIFTFYVVKFL
jgi:hypothetical protein